MWTNTARPHDIACIVHARRHVRTDPASLHDVACIVHTRLERQPRAAVVRRRRRQVPVALGRRAGRVHTRAGHTSSRPMHVHGVEQVAGAAQRGLRQHNRSSACRRELDIAAVLCC